MHGSMHGAFIIENDDYTWIHESNKHKQAMTATFHSKAKRTDCYSFICVCFNHGTSIAMRLGHSLYN